ncbi:MAG: hypothetical protein HYY49_10000 [Ignavibacteriales bacterium]|nr:hypothetical protein [Ignavibacteriales bacterium]
MKSREEHHEELRKRILALSGVTEQRMRESMKMHSTSEDNVHAYPRSRLLRHSSA